MKLWTSLLTIVSLPLSANNLAVVDETPSFSTVLEPPLEAPFVTPAFFQLDARGDWINPAKVQAENVTGERLGYAAIDTRFGYVFPYDCAMFSVAAGYQRTWISLEELHLFDRSNFHNAYVTLGARAYEGDWTYQGEFQFNADLNLNGERCYLYMYGGWATYAIFPNLTTSAGFLGRSGLRKDEFWPVLGLEWTINDEWEIHAVYPVNMSVIYRPTEFLALAAVTRIVNSRHRLSREDIIPSGLLEYKNVGEEFSIVYTPGPFLSFDVHAGYMFEGQLQVTNSYNDPLTTIKSNGSFYAGASFLFRF